MQEEYQINSKLQHGLNFLIIIDIILIILSLINNKFPYEYVMVFDLVVCLILIFEYFYRLKRSSNKVKFTKNNIIDLIAAIPFDLIIISIAGVLIPGFNSIRFLRLIRIIKLLRVSILIEKYFKNLGNFLKTTHLDTILATLFIIIIIFTFLFTYYANINLADSFWFVIITLTTVGYGDGVIRSSENGKIIAIALVFLGVFVFSTITAAISSWFTNNILEKDTEEEKGNLEAVNNKIDFIEKELERSNKNMKELSEKLEESNKNNEELKKEINELKEIIRENK